MLKFTMSRSFLFSIKILIFKILCLILQKKKTEKEFQKNFNWNLLNWKKKSNKITNSPAAKVFLSILIVMVVTTSGYCKLQDLNAILNF